MFQFNLRELLLLSACVALTWSLVVGVTPNPSVDSWRITEQPGEGVRHITVLMFHVNHLAKEMRLEWSLNGSAWVGIDDFQTKRMDESKILITCLDDPDGVCRLRIKGSEHAGDLIESELNQERNLPIETYVPLTFERIDSKETLYEVCWTDSAGVDQRVAFRIVR